MRVDVFLKQVRLIKRRTIAKELCDEGAVELNGHEVRAGREVRAGDAITLKLRNRRLEVEILEVPERPPSASASASFYRVVSDEKVDEEA